MPMEVPETIGVRGGARMLGVSTNTFYRIVAAAGVRTWAYPGAAIRYYVADLVAIVERAQGVARPGRHRRSAAFKNAPREQR